MRAAFFSRVTFLKNKYFLKIYDFKIFFEIFYKPFVVVIKTCIVTFLGINFEDKCWLGKVFNFSFFWHWARQLFALIATSLHREKEDCILLMQRIFSGEHIFRKRCNPNFLGVWAKIVKRTARLLQRNCQSCILRFQRNNLGVYFSWEIYQLLFFWVLSEKLCNFTKSFATGLRRLHFLCSEEHFRWEFFLIEFTKLYS